MGQEHSLPVQKRTPNKLSKPRTTSTANLLSRSTIQLGENHVYPDVPGQGGRYSVVFADPSIHPVALKEERQTREDKRRSIFRSQSTPNRHSLPARPDQNAILYNNYVESRQNSMVDEAQYNARPINRSRMSLQHVPGLAYQQRLSLVQEVLTPEPESSKRLSTYAELRSPTMDSHMEATSLNRTASETNLYTPMRRSSFVQHGVATRPSVAQGFEAQGNGHNYSKPIPHAYLASLRQKDMPRVETPDEMGHIGAFKLGSLRITNGVASPTPSIERAATMSAGDDYISAGNVRKMLDHRRDLSYRSNTLSTAVERAKSPWLVYEESPLRKADLPPKLDIELENLASFDFDPQVDIKSPSRAQALADEYMNDIALSPYSFAPSRTPSPQLESTSKHTAIEDDLFEAEPLTPALSYAPSVADSGYGGNSRTGSSSDRQKPLAKADSGYSSNVSLRSFSRNGSRKSGSRLPPPPVPAKDTPPLRESRIASSTYSTSSKAELKSKHSSEYVSQNLDSSHANASSTKILTAIAVSTEDLQGQKARQISVPDLKATSRYYGKHTRAGSDPKAVLPTSQKKEKLRPFSLQVRNQAHDNIDAPPVPAEAAKHLEDRVNPVPFFDSLQRLHLPGNRDTLATIMSVGSGYTDLPTDLGRNKLQEVLATPPSPVTSNSYYPPKTPPKKLQKRNSLTHDMEAYKNLRLSEQVSSDRTTHELLAVQLRSQPFTSKRTPVDRQLSSGSRTSSMTAAVGLGDTLVKKHSYESIAAKSSWSSPAESAPGSAPLQSKFLNVEEPQRRLSWGNRDKKQPPVSMDTRRKLSPAPNTSKPSPAPPRRPPPVPLIPISKEPPLVFDKPPKPPLHKSLPPSPLPLQMTSPLPSPQTPRSFAQSPEVMHDSWAAQTSYWSERRQDASDNLKQPSIRRKSESERNSRQTMSNRDSSSTMQSRGGARRPPSTHQNGNLRIQRSMEAVKARKMVEMMTSSPHLQETYQMEEMARQRRERDKAGEMLAGWQANADGSTPGEYHHTYGLDLPISPSPRSPAYFAQHNVVEDMVDVYDLHQRQNSTMDMLTMDRFSGGLGYGYQHGVGLSGSAGLSGGGEKKSVDVSRQFGLDFTDVPVFLQRNASGTLSELYR